MNNRVAYFLLLGVALAFALSVSAQSNYTEDSSAESQEELDQYDSSNESTDPSDESDEEDDSDESDEIDYGYNMVGGKSNSDYPQDEGYEEEVEEEKEAPVAANLPPCEPEYMFKNLDKVCAVYRDEDLSELEKKCKDIDTAIADIRDLISESEKEAQPLVENDDTTWTKKLSYPGIVVKKINPMEIDFSKYEDDDQTFTDCEEAVTKGHKKPGVYLLNPSESPYNVRALCVNGWTIVQRRFDGTEDFNRDFDDYMAGFGNFSSEFFLGLENLHRMAKSKDYTLRVDAKGASGKWYFGVYEDFSLTDEKDDYRLNLGNMSAGNYFDGFQNSRDQQFSTRERDNDNWRGGNCAAYYGGGWWSNQCITNLNQAWCTSGCLRWADKRVISSIIRIKPTAAVVAEDLTENPNPGGLSLDEVPA